MRMDALTNCGLKKSNKKKQQKIDHDEHFYLVSLE